MYITWYGFGRMLIEGLRTDSLMVGSFRISQVVACLCFVVGTFFLVFLDSRAHKAAKLAAAEGEVSVYGEMLNEEKQEEQKEEKEKEEKTEEKTDVSNTD